MLVGLRMISIASFGIACTFKKIFSYFVELVGTKNIQMEKK